MNSRASFNALSRSLILVAAASLGLISTPAAADNELAAAVQLIDRGEYNVAVSRLAALIEKRPNTDVANEALFYLARAYEGIGAQQQALDRYSEYLIRVPGGAHEPAAIDSFRRVLAVYQAKFPPASTTETEVDALRQTFNPDSPSVDEGLRLARGLWMLDRHEEAAEVYRVLYDADPGVAANPDFQERIELGSNGEFTLLTPQEQTRREIASRPVAVINPASYAGRRDRRTQQPRWYIVTGEVINRSEKTVDSVEVETTIFSFGTKIYDTQVQRFGRLAPGQSRAFSARFVNFEDVNNIERYECHVSFN